MSKYFDGDSQMLFPSDGIVGTGAFTMAVLVDVVATDGAWQAFMTTRATDDENGIGRTNGNGFSAFNFNYLLDSESAGTGTAWEALGADGWAIYVARRSSGTGPLTFSKKILGSGSWAHRVTTAGSNAGASSASGSIKLGDWRGSDNAVAYYAVGSMWDGTALTNTQVETLDDNLATSDWYALSPDFLVDESDDFTTNLITTTNRTSASGLGTDGSDPTSWVYGIGSTPVSATRALSYNIINSVSGQRALSYDIKAAVSATRALSYNINAAVANTRALNYDIANAISGQRALSYDIQAAVSATRALAYDIKAAISAQRALNYDILASGAVSATRALNYDIQAAVYAERALNYDIQAAVSAQRQLVYDIINAIDNQRALRYDIINSVTGERALNYNIGTVETSAGAMFMMWLD